MQQNSMESDFEDDNEICYTSKRRAHPLVVTGYDDDSYPSSSWANTNELDDDQRSSSIDYYHDDDQIDDENFQLPISANDLCVSARQALHLATIYEFLRHFSSILRLSPFLFEHFCTAMIKSIDRNNKLFSQIHICLLRLLIKQDDDDGITYASETDIKGIIDLSFVTMDYLTWPYILQLYVQSHTQLKYLTPTVQEYPFNTDLDKKIDLLLALCDLALTTKTIRREFDDTKPKQHDDNCRKCQKRGDLLCCDRCEATFHLFCLNPPLTSVPTVEWLCPVCVQNQIHGVTDCIPPREHRPFYLRHRCIGHDREQHRYWFICRRIFVEDEFGSDVRYYSTLEQFDGLLSCLDERGPERLLVYRLQKRYEDIARCMQITADLQLIKMNEIDEQQSNTLAAFTDGLNPCSIDEKLNRTQDYEQILEAIRLRQTSRTTSFNLPSQIDGIYDEDETHDPYRKSIIRKREFFAHNNGYPSKLNGHHQTYSITNNNSSMKRIFGSREDQLRHENNIRSEISIPVHRLNVNEIPASIWQRYERYRSMNRYSNTRGASSYPRTNYYRDYYTGNNYEDEYGTMLNNEYDDFGDDFFQQEENQDEFDMPFRKYESNRIYRGTSRGRPRGRGRPPLYGRTGGRSGSNSGQPPRGVNHLTTGSFQSNVRLIQPKLETPKPVNETSTKNKRKPAKVKTVPVVNEEKPKRPGKILRSGRISRKPRRDSETDFGSDNSDDSGAKNKDTGSDDDEEFSVTQLGLPTTTTMNLNSKTTHDGSISSNSNDSLPVTNAPLTNFAAFAQSQLLATTLANGTLPNPDEISVDSDFSSNGIESDDANDEMSHENEEMIDDFTYSQTMLSLINSVQPNNCKLDLDLVPKTRGTSNVNDDPPYENFYQTNPLATRKQSLLHERDRRAHLARKFSINQQPSFSWFAPNSSLTSHYSLRQLSDIIRLTLVHFENTIPLPFMHSHWKRYRYIWAKELLDLDRNLSLKQIISFVLQFEASIKPVSYFDLFTDQVGYLKFRRETEKERDEAKKEEKDALIRRKIDADSIIQTVRFTRPLKHSVHRQRGEEYRLAGGQGWTFLRSTRRSAKMRKQPKHFDINSLLTHREHLSDSVQQERQRILALIESQLRTDFNDSNHIEQEMDKLLSNSREDENDDISDEQTFINYKIIDYNGVRYRYPIMCEDTRRSFHLKTPQKSSVESTKNPFQLPLPWTFSFDDQPANIFILPPYILRRLARGSMTMIDAPGFLNSRLSGIGTRFGWPYPCGRPSIRTAWCFKVQTSSSLFTIAHQLKYLWHCIRWELLTEKLSDIDESSITTQIDQDGITTTVHVLSKRDSGPYNSYCEYFVRKTISSQTSENAHLNSIAVSKSRSRAVPHPSSMLTSNRLILTEQWLPERQLQPNQIKYYYQSLQNKLFKRLHKKPRTEKKIDSKPIQMNQTSTAKPFIVRIPHLQSNSTLSTDSGKVVLVKSTNETPSSSSTAATTITTTTASTATPTKSFSVVKLADGQIILVPTSNERVATSSTVPSTSNTTSPQERRLRLIAPSPMTITASTSAELMNSLLQQQQQHIEPEIPVISTSSTILTPSLKQKNRRKVVPIVTGNIHERQTSKDESRLSIDKKSNKPAVKRPKTDPEDAIRMKLCEAALRSLITKIEREQSQTAARKRLLNERVDVLRKDIAASLSQTNRN